MAHEKRQRRLEKFLDGDQTQLPVGQDILNRGATGVSDPANVETVVPDPGIETSGLAPGQLPVAPGTPGGITGEELPQLQADRFQTVIPNNFFSPRDQRSLRGGDIIQSTFGGRLIGNVPLTASILNFNPSAATQRLGDLLKIHKVRVEGGRQAGKKKEDIFRKVQSWNSALDLVTDPAYDARLTNAFVDMSTRFMDKHLAANNGNFGDAFNDLFQDREYLLFKGQYEGFGENVKDAAVQARKLLDEIMTDKITATESTINLLNDFTAGLWDFESYTEGDKRVNEFRDKIKVTRDVNSIVGDHLKLIQPGIDSDINDDLRDLDEEGYNKYFTEIQTKYWDKDLNDGTGQTRLDRTVQNIMNGNHGIINAGFTEELVRDIVQNSLGVTQTLKNSARTIRTKALEPARRTGFIGTKKSTGDYFVDVDGEIQDLATAFKGNDVAAARNRVAQSPLLKPTARRDAFAEINIDFLRGSFKSVPIEGRDYFSEGNGTEKPSLVGDVGTVRKVFVVAYDKQRLESSEVREFPGVDPLNKDDVGVLVELNVTPKPVTLTDFESEKDFKSRAHEFGIPADTDVWLELTKGNKIPQNPRVESVIFNTSSDTDILALQSFFGPGINTLYNQLLVARAGAAGTPVPPVAPTGDTAPQKKTIPGFK